MKSRPYFSSLLLVLAIFGGGYLVSRPPYTPSAPEGSAVVHLDPIVRQLDRPGWTVHAAWHRSGGDYRFRGLSGLEFRDGKLTALNDGAYRLDFVPPESGSREIIADIRILRDGAGAVVPTRDTEAIAWSQGRWWVSVEGANLVWEMDGETPRVRHAIRVELPLSGNGGIEAILPAKGEEPMLWIAERQPIATAWNGKRSRQIDVVGARGWVTGAARLGDGRIVILSRTLGLRGIGARLALARLDGSRLLVGPSVRLPTTTMENVEGVAVQPLAPGRDRIWLVSDDNVKAVLNGLLMAIDVDADAWP